MSGEELREILFKELQTVFGENNVETKWKATAESTDAFDSNYMYTPETDIVVHPLNIDGNIELNNKKINEALEKNKEFLGKLNELADKKYNEWFLNKNPRCFIAIEVGGSGSRKHFLGDMFNSSILGKIGIVVGLNSEKTKIYRRIFEYVDLAHTVGKTEQNFGNVVILNGEKFLNFLRNYNHPTKN